MIDGDECCRRFIEEYGLDKERCEDSITVFSMTQIIRKQVINPILLILHLKLLSLNRRSIGMKMAAGHTDASLLLK